MMLANRGHYFAGAAVSAAPLVCLTGTCSGLLRAALEQLGADKTHEYMVYALDDLAMIAGAASHARHVRTPSAVVICYETTSHQSVHLARSLRDSIIEQHEAVPIVIVGVQAAGRSDPDVISEGESLAQDTCAVAHVADCTPLCRVSVSDVYLTTAVATLGSATTARRGSSLTVSKMYLDDLSSMYPISASNTVDICGGGSDDSFSTYYRDCEDTTGGIPSASSSLPTSPRVPLTPQRSFARRTSERWTSLCKRLAAHL